MHHVRPENVKVVKKFKVQGFSQNKCYYQMEISIVVI